RKSPVVSDAQLLPLAARQPVLAGGPDRRARFVRPPDRCREGQPSLSGRADVRHGPARRGRFVVGAPPASADPRAESFLVYAAPVPPRPVATSRPPPARRPRR